MKKVGWLKNRWFLGGSTLSVLLIVFIVGVENKLWPSWTGFVADVETSTSIEKNSNGTVTKLTETSKNQSGKTLWDVLGLLGVPIVLLLLGNLLQQQEQKRSEQRLAQDKVQAEARAKQERDTADKRLEQDKKIAADNQTEEALQAYFDRLSTLLVDKNLIARAKHGKGQDEQVKAATDVIQAWTRSVLRRLENDPERKVDVFLFLINTEVLSKLKLEVNQFNLKGLNLKEINFRKTNLEGIDFSGIDLSGANLEGVILSGANLSRANLTKAKFFYFDSIYKIDEDTDEGYWMHVGTDLRGANLHGANLHGTDLRFVNFEGADLRQATLEGAIFTGTSVELHPSSDYYYSEYDVPANLSKAKLSGVSLEKINFTKVGFFEANLEGANLSGANLEGADLSAANLEGANLEGANLSDAELKYVNLSSTNLNSANLSKSLFLNADFSSANLSGADLRDTELKYVNFSRANLTDANFSSADLSEAILLVTDLSTAKNLASDQLAGENPPYLCKVNLPPSIQVDGNRDCEKLPQVLRDRYPERFKTLEEAKAYVDEL